MAGKTVFITPTFGPDWERFTLQRESMERCGIDIPHIAIVNHEDMRHFSEVPFRKNLTLLSTVDVLPPSFEKRRKLWGMSRRYDVRHWFSGAGIHGWMIQQLLKLSAPKYTDAETIVCLDSDLFFVDRVTPEDFLASDGRTLLYETEDEINAQMAEWYAHALRFLKLPTLGTPLKRYTHAPVPWRREVLEDLHKYIEKRKKKPWLEAVAEADRLAEYTLYGTYARHMDGFKRVEAAKPDKTLYFWWPGKDESIDTTFHARLAATGAKMVLVNSNLDRPVHSYRALAESAWEKTERQAPRSVTI